MPQPDFTPDVDVYDKMPAGKFLVAGKPRIAKPRKAKFRRHKDTWWERYQRYLGSSKWSAFKDALFKKRGRMCERCGQSGVSLHVHHLSYVRLEREEPEDVLILCVPCHQKRHMDRKA